MSIGRAANLLARLWLLAIVTYVAAVILVVNVRDYESWPMDFTVFWRAAVLAVRGEALALFDSAALADVWTFPDGRTLTAYWLYPPTWLVLLAPLGLLPFSAALVVYVVLSLGLLVLALRPAARALPGGVMLVLASPAVPLAVQVGNTSLFLCAALAAVTWRLATERQSSAGVAIAAFAIKPQFGLAFPFALAAGRQWRAFGAAAAATLAFAGLATLALGTGYWEAFFRRIARHATEAEAEGFHYMLVSVYGAALALGLGAGAALAVHALAATAALAALARAMSRAPRSDATLALLCLVVPFLSPRTFFYETILFLVAFVHLWRAGAQRHWPGRLALAICWCGWPLFDHAFLATGTVPLFGIACAYAVAYASVMTLVHENRARAEPA